MTLTVKFKSVLCVSKKDHTVEVNTNITQITAGNQRITVK